MGALVCVFLATLLKAVFLLACSLAEGEGERAGKMDQATVDFLMNYEVGHFVSLFQQLFTAALGCTRGGGRSTTQPWNLETADNGS